MSVFPLTRWATARARHYQLALCMRVGAPLLEFQPGPGGMRVACCCGQQHDSFGWHVGVCRRGNRLGLWQVRHDAAQIALMVVSRRHGCTVHDCSTGSGSWFGAAGYRPGSSRSRAADLVYVGFYGVGSHLFVDVAVTDPGSGAALAAAPSSDTSSGVAALQRSEKKCQKYEPLAAAVGSWFRPGVMERYGTVSEGLHWLLRSLAGDRDRDPRRCDDYTEPARSCITYMAGMVVFGGVMGDAAIVDTVISEDCVRAGVAGLRPAAARVVGAGRRQGDVADTPDQRDVEGLGGQFWYEARMGGGS